MASVELLSPAGTLQHLQYAFAYGADAVYAGQPRYSLRVRNNSFRDNAALAEAIDYAHARGKRFFLASNIAPHNDKVRSYLRDLEPVIALRPDALIMSDPGLIMLVRERWPEQTIHLSVQANAVNWAAVRFWQRQGIERVILSRELSLEEVEEIRQRVPDIELEVFVHGALCMAYSGRCLLSGYMNHRDANQGACTNACRWEYQPVAHARDSSGDLMPVKQVDPAAAGATVPVAAELRDMLLEDPHNPGDYVPVHEDEHGTYIMNSRDLRAVQHVGELLRIGVDSLKIEGRTKSAYYVARTAQVYRRAIDDALAGRDFDMQLMDELEALSNRGYTEGFYRRHPPEAYQQYERGTSALGSEQLVGAVIAADEEWLTIDVKNRFAAGDRLMLLSPSGNLPLAADGLQDPGGTPVDVAPGSGYTVRLPRPAALRGADYCLLTRQL